MRTAHRHGAEFKIVVRVRLFAENVFSGLFEGLMYLDAGAASSCKVPLAEQYLEKSETFKSSAIPMLGGLRMDG